MPKKLTLEDMCRLARQHGGMCLSDTYVNSKTKLLWECVEEHRWKALPTNVNRGTWCPVCAKGNSGHSQRLSLEDMMPLAKKYGGKCLSEKYVNSQTKLTWSSCITDENGKARHCSPAISVSG